MAFRTAPVPAALRAGRERSARRRSGDPPPRPVPFSRRGRGRISAALTILAALFSGLSAAPHGAAAYTAAGDRLFPATLVLPQFAPGDELYLWSDTQPLSGGPTGAGTRASTTAAVYAKTITERLGIVVEESWTRLDRVRRGTWSAMQNLDTEVKYLAIDDQPHEFLLTLGLDREFGGTGGARIGAFASGATTPRLYLAKGLGDLDIGALRPLAIGALLGWQIADSRPRPDLITPGFVIEYSIPYLQSKVQSFGLPGFIAGLTPITEVSLTIPAGTSFGARTTAVIAPGLSYAGAGWEVAIEALVPMTRATGRGVGAIAQFHLSLDYLAGDTIGRPLFSEP